jgi:hypothetical protein
MIQRNRVDRTGQKQLTHANNRKTLGNLFHPVKLARPVVSTVIWVASHEGVGYVASCSRNFRVSTTQIDPVDVLI